MPQWRLLWLWLSRTLIGSLLMVTLAQSSANWHNTHSHRLHAFTHTVFTSTQLQQRGAKRQLSYYFYVHAGSFGVSVIHQTLTWTTGSFNVCTWSFLRVRIHTCVYTDYDACSPGTWSTLVLFAFPAWRGLINLNAYWVAVYVVLVILLVMLWGWGGFIWF